MTAIDERARVYADRDWWRSAGNILGLELRGWTFRNEASFADRDTDRRVEIPGWLAERILQALNPGSTGDWVLVPKEPTEKMLWANAGSSDCHKPAWNRSMWAAFLAAAPEPPSAMLAAAGGRDE